MIDEREFEMINILASDANSTQRDIAARMEMSLGMVNILLKRLVTKGYLRAQQLDGKKIRYSLTPSGIGEKARKSYRYTIKTIASLKTIRSGLRQVLQDSYDQGNRDFMIVGNNDLSDLVEITLRDFGSSDLKVERLPESPRSYEGTGVYLLTNGESVPKNPKVRSISLIRALAKTIPIRATSEQVKVA